MKRTKNGNGQIFVALYFAYEFPGGKSGYGVINHYDTHENTFVHKDMWVDQDCVDSNDSILIVESDSLIY